MDAAEPWSAKGPRAAAAVLTARVGADKAGLQRAPRKDAMRSKGLKSHMPQGNEALAATTEPVCSRSSPSPPAPNPSQHQGLFQ